MTIKEVIEVNISEPLLDTSDSGKAFLVFLKAAFFEVEPCLKVASRTENGETDETRVGVEANYRELEKLMISDIVTIKMLLRRAQQHQAASDGRQIKKVEAGSITTEWENTDPQKSVNTLSIREQIGRFKSAALQKAWQLGCQIVIDDGLINELRKQAAKGNYARISFIRSKCK